MDNSYFKIQELLHGKADLQARFKLLSYDVTPEIKNREGGKYLYIRKRVGSRLTSTYIDAYSDELYELFPKMGLYFGDNTFAAKEIMNFIIPEGHNAFLDADPHSGYCNSKTVKACLAIF